VSEWRRRKNGEKAQEEEIDCNACTIGEEDENKRVATYKGMCKNSFIIERTEEFVIELSAKTFLSLSLEEYSTKGRSESQ
jgi:hypothetical protein